LPAIRDALQLVLAAIFEGKAQRPRQVLHGKRERGHVRLRTPSVNLPGEMISVVISRMNGYFPDWRFSETEPHEALVVLRCPQCTKQGTFESSGSYDHGGVADDGVAIVGRRRCPDPTCRALVFFALTRDVGSSSLTTYPPEAVDFDRTNLPAAAVEDLEGAMLFRAARSYKVAASILRRRLIGLCDERGADVGTLKNRLIALGDSVVLPAQLMDGLDEVRLLRAFDMNSEDIEEGLVLTKDLLKAIYQ